MALSDAEIRALYADETGFILDESPAALLDFARAIEAETRRDALEKAEQLVEKATYRKRWVKAAINGQANNVPPCELAAAIRKLKEDTQ